MHRQQEQQILSTRSFHPPSGDSHIDRALKESIHVEVHGVEARLQRPLQFEQILPGGTVERALVSRFEIIFLSIFRNWNACRVSQFANRLLDPLHLLPADEQVDVAGLPQRHVAVINLRQRQPLVRNRFDSECINTIQNANQFAREKKRLVNVLLVALAKRGPYRGRNHAVQLCESVMHQRRGAVLVREPNHRLPIHLRLEESSNANESFLARINATGSQQKIPLAPTRRSWRRIVCKHGGYGVHWCPVMLSANKPALRLHVNSPCR